MLVCRLCRVPCVLVAVDVVVQGWLQMLPQGLERRRAASCDVAADEDEIAQLLHDVALHILHNASIRPVERTAVFDAVAQTLYTTANRVTSSTGHTL